MTDRVREHLVKRQQEREEGFESSSVHALLSLLGWDLADIRKEKHDLGPDFGWYWFNGLGELQTIEVGSTLIPEFNLIDLITKPTKHPITVAWEAWRHEHADAEHGALVFRVHTIGRMVITDAVPGPGVSVVVNLPDHQYCLAPFKEFFTPYKKDRDE